MHSSVTKADGQPPVKAIPESFPANVVSESKPFSLFVVQAFWVLMVYEVDIFLSAITGGPFYRIPFVLAPLLIILVVSNKNDGRVLYWPLIIFLLLHVGASVFAEKSFSWRRRRPR